MLKLDSDALDPRPLEQQTVTGYRHTLLLAAAAIAANLIVAVFFLLLAVPSYTTNDDVAMMRIASGLMTGEPSEYLVFTNILIGKMLKQLYQFDRDLNWYSIYVYSCHFAAMTGLLFVFLRMQFWRIGVLVYFLVLIGYELRFLVSVQFTSTAVVAAMCGVVMLLLGGGDRERRSTSAAVMGVLLIVLSAMIRPKAFYLSVFILSPLVLAETWRLRSWRIPAYGAVAVLLAMAAIGYNYRAYQQDPAWREYMEYNAVRGRIHDYSVLNYENREPLLEQVGWSDNDARMFQIWFFTDPEVFSAEKLRTLRDAYDGGEGERSTWYEVIQRRLYPQLSYVYFAAFLFVLGWFLSSGNRRTFLVTASAVAMVAVACLIYLASQGKLPPRVSLSMFAAVSVACLYLAVNLRDEDKAAWEKNHSYFWSYALTLNFMFLVSAKKVGASAETAKTRRLGFLQYESPISPRDLMQLGLAFALVVLVFMNADRITSIVSSNARKVQYLDQSLETLRHNVLDTTPDAVFVAVGAAFPFEWSSSFSGGRKLQDIPMLSLGWVTHSPHFEASLERFSIDDVYRALYERPNVYLMCREMDLPIIERYLEEHYGVHVEIRELYSSRFDLYSVERVDAETEPTSQRGKPPRR